jgi:hypothetical protein
MTQNDPDRMPNFAFKAMAAVMTIQDWLSSRVVGAFGVPSEVLVARPRLSAE